MSDPCIYCRQDREARDHSDCDAWMADTETVKAKLRTADVPDRDKLADAAIHALGCARPGQRVRIVTALIDAWDDPERAR